MKTPDEINAANAEFWKTENKRFRRLVENPPNPMVSSEDARWYLERCKAMNETPEQGRARVNKMREEVAAREREDEITVNIGSDLGRKEKQSEAGKCRWKKKDERPTYASEFIAAMKKARQNHETLDGFIDSLKAKSVADLWLTIENERCKKREHETYRLFAANVPDSASQNEDDEGLRYLIRTHKTLLGWWTKAGKNLHPK